jgi:uncharacterized protein YhaN
MKRTGYLGMSLFLILILMVAELPGLAQGTAPAPKTQAEYNDYRAAYDEKDPAKKAELAEKYVTAYKDADPAMMPSAYSLIIGGYTNSKNWAKVIDAADRAVALPNVDNRTKAFAYANAMSAAQNMTPPNVDKVIEYGDKVLGMAPNDLNTLIVLATYIPQKYPGNKAQLDKAVELATRALAGLEDLIAKATPQEKPAYVQYHGSMHQTLGLIAYNNKEYTKSIQENELAIKDNPKDDAAHFYMAYVYLALMVDASKSYQASIQKERDAIAAKADQPTMDEIKAQTTDFGDKVKAHRDKAIDELAIAVAIGGPSAAPAQAELTKQWTAKNNDTTGMQEAIDQKKAALK